MALIQPILYQPQSFDATVGYVFQFNVVGGSLVVGSRLTILNNTTLEQVFTDSVTQAQFEHTLPADKLQNGETYQAYINTFDSNGNVSPNSNTVLFSCYAVPVVNISNIPITNTINSPSFNFEATYSQVQGVSLTQYQFSLYDSAGLLVSTSGVQYTTAAPSKVNYIFTGMEKNKSYSVECVVANSAGMSVSTGKKSFVVQYSSSDTYTTLSLINDCNTGQIIIQSKATGIDGTPSPADWPNPPHQGYIDVGAPYNRKAAYFQQGESVTWDDNYVIPADFTLQLWRSAPVGETLQLSNANGDKLVLTGYDAIDYTMYVILKVIPKEGQYYTIKSNTIQLPKTEAVPFLNISIWLRSVGGLYDLILDNLGVVNRA